MALITFLMISRCLRSNGKALILNTGVIVFLIAYTLFGGYIFLHFEYNYAQHMKMNDTLMKKECIEKLLARDRELRISSDETDFAHVIAEKCLTETQTTDPRLEWSFKTAALFGFGILTTLGYGKVEPRTLNGRIFTVIYGFIGIPITVILLTNVGRYLEQLILRIRRLCTSKVDDADNDVFNGTTLFFVMVVYLLLGAVFISLLNEQPDFFNGIYFAFICLTAIEYGDLVPENDWYIPFVIVYVCIGLAISTIALDIGSYYVRKMHYIGRKLKNIANIRIWFGARNLQVKELVRAVGQNIGISENAMADIDLETLVNTAILVKLGRLSRVPQTHMIVDGIWPPELVPLFLKDGQFPMFVDSEDDLDVTPKKTVVRFQDEVVSSDIEDITTADSSHCYTSRLSPDPTDLGRHPSKSISSSLLHSRSFESEQSLQDTTVDTFIQSSS